MGWFQRLGQPFTEEDRKGAQAYLDAIGYDTLVLGPVTTSLGALAIMQSSNWDARWWDAESGVTDALRRSAQNLHGITETFAQIDAATLDQGDAIYRAAQYKFCAQEDLVKAAAGAGSLALYQFTLARLAQAPPDHLFMRKYALFESGRWPLGVFDDTFHLY